MQKDDKIVKVKIPCYIDGQKTIVDVFIGRPKDHGNPLGFQSKFLSENKGVRIPDSIINSFNKLVDIAKKYDVSLQDLCLEAFSAVSDAQDATQPTKKDPNHNGRSN